MYTLKERERRLFEDWREARGYGSFVRDGVFDEAVWTRQERKITFLLKEPNWPEGNGDLCESIIQHPSRSHWPTWNNAARWTQALLEGGPYPRRVSPEARVAWLRRVSFLNLKKTGGGASSRNAEIRAYARRDAPFLRRQLALYAPDLIVCCGPSLAGILAQEVLLHPGLDPLPILDRPLPGGLPGFYAALPGRDLPTAVLSFRHPQKRYSSHAQWQSWYSQLLPLCADGGFR